jgi:hypothetical protein
MNLKESGAPVIGLSRPPGAGIRRSGHLRRAIGPTEFNLDPSVVNHYFRQSLIKYASNPAPRSGCRSGEFLEDMG